MGQFVVGGRKYVDDTEAGAKEQHAAYEASTRKPLWVQRIGQTNVRASKSLEEEGAKLHSRSPLIKGGLQKWIHIPVEIRQKLEAAIKAAPIMVREALRLLNEHKNQSATTNVELDYTEVGLALVKYFNLSFSTPSTQFAATSHYWRYVDGIIAVFDQIKAGLQSEHTIELGLFDSRGRVRGWELGGLKLSTIRQTFGFADEWGHVEYTGFGKYGHIELGYGYLCDPEITSDWVARTIVHEASHKFALTKDVLYKHQSFGKTRDLGAEDRSVLDAGAISRPGRSDDKKMNPMLGREKGSQNLISTERWLENADSYAWLARRLWKRSNRPLT